MKPTMKTKRFFGRLFGYKKATSGGWYCRHRSYVQRDYHIVSLSKCFRTVKGENLKLWQLVIGNHLFTMEIKERVKHEDS